MSAPAQSADPKKFCVFNSNQTSIDDVVATAGAQAQLAGYQPSPLVPYTIARRIDDAAESKDVGDIAQVIIGQLKAGASIKDDVDKLLTMEMGKLLKVMDALKGAGVLTDFDDRVGANVDNRIAVAIRTVVAPPFDYEWRNAVRALNDADRAAVLARAPQDAIDALDSEKDDDKKRGQIDPAKPDDGTSTTTIGILFVPKQIDNLLAGKGTPGQTHENPQIQVTGQYTFKFRNTKFHFEESVFCQGTFSKDMTTRRVQFQPMFGSQIAAVLKLADQIVLQGFGQVLGGASLTLDVPVTGTPITCAQTTVTGQVVAGGQAVFSIPGTSLQLVLQGQVSITGTPNMLAFNKATGIGLQVQF